MRSYIKEKTSLVSEFFKQDNIIKKYFMDLIIGVCVLGLILFSAHALSSKDFTETDYVDHYCPMISEQHEIEKVLEDRTRIDCYTPSEAIEFDYAKKWYECVGQALHYSRLTGKAPACALIVDQSSDLEKEYVERARKTVKHFDLPVRIFTVNSTVE